MEREELDIKRKDVIIQELIQKIEELERLIRDHENRIIDLEDA